MNNQRIGRMKFLGLAALMLFHLACLTMTPLELNQKRADGEKLTVIDIRSHSLFERSHISGSINIPLDLIPVKQLPPLGDVVVCGSGLGLEDTQKAVDFLSAKKGIRPVVLEGGFAAWESMVGVTTQQPGLHDETLPFITYDQIQVSTDKDLVLVDLRSPNQSARQRLSTKDSEWTDLKTAFPGRPVIRSPFQRGIAAQSVSVSKNSVPPLMVLIDNNDGKARETARILRAQGVRRVIILAGGEEMIKRQGRPGLQRLGPGSKVVSGDAESDPITPEK